MKKSLIIIPLLVAVLAVVILAARHGSHSVQSSKTATTTSTQDSNANSTVADRASLETVLETQSTDPLLKAGNFSIVSNTPIVSDWYIAIVSQGGGSSDNVVLILKHTGQSYTIVMGPGTAFAQSELTRLAVPQEVQDNLTVYNDAS